MRRPPLSQTQMQEVPPLSPPLLLDSLVSVCMAFCVLRFFLHFLLLPCILPSFCVRPGLLNGMRGFIPSSTAPACCGVAMSDPHACRSSYVQSLANGNAQEHTMHLPVPPDTMVIGHSNATASDWTRPCYCTAACCPPAPRGFEACRRVRCIVRPCVAVPSGYEGMDPLMGVPYAEGSAVPMPPGLFGPAVPFGQPPPPPPLAASPAGLTPEQLPPGLLAPPEPPPPPPMAIGTELLPPPPPPPPMTPEMVPLTGVKQVWVRGAGTSHRSCRTVARYSCLHSAFCSLARPRTGWTATITPIRRAECTL